MRTKLGEFLEWVRRCQQARARRGDEAEISGVLRRPSASSPRRLQFLGWLLIFGSVVTAMVGCAGRAKDDTGTVVVACETAEQIRSLRHCKATMEKCHPCYSVFRTEDGRALTIGSPGASPDVTQFLRTLKEGQTYAFPKTFIDYQRTRDQRDG